MSRQKLSYRMHTKANKGVVTGKWKKDVRTTIALWAYEVAALEAKLEAMAGALNDCLSDLEWAERTLPGTNFQASILKGRAAAQQEK